jgi:hypothetical protein
LALTVALSCRFWLAGTYISALNLPNSSVILLTGSMLS